MTFFFGVSFVMFTEYLVLCYAEYFSQYYFTLSIFMLCYRCLSRGNSRKKIDKENYKKDYKLCVSIEDTSVSEIPDDTNVSESEERNSISEDGLDSGQSWEEMATNL